MPHDDEHVREAREQLYGLSLAEFTPARNALARELRREGHGEAAAEVATLPKPTVAAWAANQLARHQGKALGALLRAGDALREAQAALLSGKGGREGLEEALRDERQQTRWLTETARGLLADGGHKPTEATLEKVRTTLHAAALDPAVAEQLTGGGGVAREQETMGLEALAAMPAPSRRETGRRSAPARPARRQAPAAPPPRARPRRDPAVLAGARDELRQARAAAAERRQELKTAERAARQAREAAERAVEAAREAEEEVEQARRALEAAEEAHAAAGERLDALEADR